MLDPRTVAVAYVRTLLGAIETYGVATAAVLKGTRIDPHACRWMTPHAARRMGYHDASSLSRAAKRWFGKTAGQHRLDSR